MKNPWCQYRALMAVSLVLWLAGCGSDLSPSAPPATTNNATTNNTGVADLDAALADARKDQRPVMILVAEKGLDSADNDAIGLLGLLEDPAVQSKTDRVTPVLLDVRISRNRATAARFHITETPMLVCLSPRGVILSRNEKPITRDLVLRQIEETVRLAPELDSKLSSLEEAVAKNPNDAAAKLNLADFLLSRQNAREAIPHLASVAHCEAAEAKVRVRAWVSLARAHLWIAEPEKARHEAKDLIATLGTTAPEALAGGNLVLGLQDARAKRFALARREFEDAIAAAPDSIYAKQAAEEAAKLPTGGK